MLLPQRTRTKFTGGDITVLGCRYWYELDLDIRGAEAHDRFKLELKSYEGIAHHR